ncbi:MAG: ribonuclease HI family protein [Candidatus Brocadiia bacterium]|nr:ribonuclease HI family protein [Candidatus Brocadiia bacterium]
MNDREMLRAVYGAIEWARLFEAHPELSREEVDEFFSRLADSVGDEAQSAPAPPPSPTGAAIEGIVLHCDGASSGNPGPASIGVVLRARDGTELESWGRSVGRQTNNAAEYLALIAGLERALELGAKSVEVRSDSELMVRQLEGRYRVKNAGLRPLYQKALALLNRLERWSVRHVTRDHNTKADALAKAAIQKGKRTR